MLRVQKSVLDPDNLFFFLPRLCGLSSTPLKLYNMLFDISPTMVANPEEGELHARTKQCARHLPITPFPKTSYTSRTIQILTPPSSSPSLIPSLIPNVIFLAGANFERFDNVERKYHLGSTQYHLHPDHPTP